MKKCNFIATYFKDFSVCKPRANSLRRYILRAGKQSEMVYLTNKHAMIRVLKNKYTVTWGMNI